MSEDQLFRAVTREGFMLKILAELLQANIKTSCFTLSKNGIKLCMMNSTNTMLFDINLRVEQFSYYKYNISDPCVNIGINNLNLHKMLKSIKKCDAIELSIAKKDLSELQIKIIPKDNTQTTTSVVRIQLMQNIEPEIPTDYDCHPIFVPSREFQKMCKGLHHVSNTTNIYTQGHFITFFTDADGIMKRETTFGEHYVHNVVHEKKFNENFETEHLVKIAKIAGLSSHIQIYVKPNQPIFFKSLIGSIGEISVYLKSKNMQEYEATLTN